MNKTWMPATALALVLALVGCSTGEKTRVAATYDGGEIPAGVYTYYVISAYNEAHYRVPDYTADVFKQEIDGVKSADWMVERAREQTRAFVAAEAECRRLDIALSDEAVAAVRQSIDQAWEADGAAMERNGVARSSIEAIALNAQKSQLLFRRYYGAGGEQEVPEAELLAYYQDNYRRALTLAIPKYENQAMLTGEELTAREAEIDDYFKRARAGEPLFDLIVEYDEKQHAANGEHTHGPLVESQQESVIPKVSSSYATLFLDQLFGNEALNTVERYDNGDYEIIYERRELMGDGLHYASAKESIRQELKGEAFLAELAQKADALNLVFNDAVINTFHPTKLDFSQTL